MSSNNRLLLADYLQGQGNFGRNYIQNTSGFRNATKGITASGATVTRNTTTPLTAISDVQISLGANTHYAEFATNSLDRSLSGQTCEMTADYKLTLGSGATVQAQVLINGTTVHSTDLVATTTVNKVSLIYPCGDLSTSTTVRFAQTVAATTSTLNVANVYLGAAKNIGTVAQATLVGTLTYAGAASCSWQRTGVGSDSYGNFSADTDCSTPTVTGSVSAPGTKIPGIVLSNLSPGNYKVVARFSGEKASIQNVGVFFRMSDGTNVSTGQAVYPGETTSLNVPVSLIHTFQYTASQSSVTIQLQGRAGNTSETVSIYNAESNVGLYFEVYRFPTASETIARLDAPGVLPTAYTPTFTNFTAASSTFYYQCLAPQLVKIWGKVTSTGAGSGSEARVGLPTNFNIDTTSAPATTSLGYGARSTVAAASYGVLSDGSAGYLTFGGQASGNAGLTKLTGAQLFDAALTFSFSATVPVTASSPCAKSPQVLIPGSVYSSSAGVERVERVQVSGAASNTACTSTPCVVQSQSGSVSSVTRSGTGTYAVNFSTGTFSAAPTCTCSSTRPGTGPATCSQIENPSATSSGFTSHNNGTAVDGWLSITCQGPR